MLEVIVPVFGVLEVFNKPDSQGKRLLLYYGKKIINQMTLKNCLVVLVFICIQTVSYAQYTGGSGKGDATTSRADVPLFNRWERAENNRVLTRAAFNSAIEIGVFTANALTDDLRTINANTISASTYTPTMSGIDYGYTVKNTAPRRQLLIKGDFRSIRIDITNRPSTCAQSLSFSFNQTLWLNNDQIIADPVSGTLCYTQKDLQSGLFNGDSGYYRIQGGRAIRINNEGRVIEVCTIPQ